jgi:AsmA protein
MKRTLKILATLIGVVLLLIAAAVVIVPLVVDPNSFRDDIASAVKENTGRDLTIEGDLQLSVFPWLGLKMGRASLSNAEGFGDEPFASIDSAQVKVQLMPLLEKKVEMDTVVLSGLHINLARDEQGRGNWEDLATAGEPEEKPDRQEREKKGQPLAALAIGGVRIEDARLVWDDRMAGTRYELDKLNLETGVLLPGRPVDVELGFDLHASEPELDASLALSTTLEVNTTTGVYQANGLDLTVRAHSEPLAVRAAEVKLAGDILLNMSQQVLGVSSLKLSADYEGGEPAMKAHVELSSGLLFRTLEQRLLMENAVLKVNARGETLPGGAVDAVLKTHISADIPAQTASLSELELEGMGLYVSGHINASRLMETPQAEGTLNIGEFNPRELMKTLGIAAPATRDTKALTRMRAELDYRADQNSLDLKRLLLKLDETTMTGKASAIDFKRLAYRFDLDVDAIDADRYLPPPAEEEKTATGTPASSAPISAPATTGNTGQSTAAAPAGRPSAGTGTAAPQGIPIGLPIDLLRQLDVDGTLRVGRLKVNNLKISDARLTIKANKGLVRIKPFQASLYQGHLDAKGSVDVRGKTPRYQVEKHFSGIQIGPLLKDLTGEDRLMGTARMNASMSTAGLTDRDLRAALNGKLDFRFDNGAVKGINIGELIRSARTAIEGGATATDSTEKQTDFTQMSGSAVIRNGVLRNEDLKAKSPLLRVDGSGSVDLVRERLDYLVKAVIVGTSKGQGGAELADLKGLPIPVRIRGSFADPSYSVDLGKILEAKAKEKLKAKLQEKLQEKLGAQVEEKVQEKLQDQLKDTLMKGLKGLFR